jgi:hypothetical protein
MSSAGYAPKQMPRAELVTLKPSAAPKPNGCA